MLTNPLRDRFGIVARLGVLYGRELARIVQRSRAAQCAHGRGGRFSRSPAARAARRALPTGCCAGCATMPKSRRRRITKSIADKALAMLTWTRKALT